MLDYLNLQIDVVPTTKELVVTGFMHFVAPVDDIVTPLVTVTQTNLRTYKQKSLSLIKKN